MLPINMNIFPTGCTVLGWSNKTRTHGKCRELWTLRRAVRGQGTAHLRVGEDSSIHPLFAKRSLGVKSLRSGDRAYRDSFCVVHSSQDLTDFIYSITEAYFYKYQCLKQVNGSCVVTILMKSPEILPGELGEINYNE